ncbi:MAG: hypothetical protein FWD96_04530 [Defluviitaleaceae bacterium]|nr:hypothetical protein [Defluviitaleaceae bacterium]
MSVSGVSNNNNANLINQAPQNQNQGANAQGTGQSAQGGLPPSAIYQASGNAPASNNSNNASNSANNNANRFRPDMDTVNRLRSQGELRTQQLTDLVERMFGIQVRTLNSAVDEIRNGDLSDIDPEIAAQAQRDIADDGYWGVEQTSQRILDFARAISGGDPARIDLLERAVEQGFAAAERQWGGRLPDISQRTMEAVRQGFNDWREEAGVGNAQSAVGN